MMNILLVFSGFIIAFITVLYYERKIRRTEPKNKVHFYIARDRDNNTLYIYLGKPRRGVGYFYPSDNGSMIAIQDLFPNFGLDERDFDNLKFEDEPAEVFINMED